jgi:peptidoglycan/xylan/chitin deacetylase (PgdA/CDA1 family)
MLIRRQDFSVLILYWLGYSRIRNLLLRAQHKCVATFVCFHDLPSESIGCFKANLRFLKERTNVVTLDDFFAGKLSSKKINVVITFDDGYKSWITNVIPVLKHLGLPATFFISSGFIGLSETDQHEFMRLRLQVKLEQRTQDGGLDVEDVRRLSEEGFAVGGHTVNHCNLAEVRDLVRLRSEIVEDKERLERIIGKKIAYFAYPFGSCQSAVTNLEEILRESGYEGAVTTVSGLNRVGSTNPYFLHREITYTAMRGSVFRARVLGNYHLIGWLRQRMSITS